MPNKQLNPNFEKVCVWPGTIVGEEKIAEFEAWMLSDLHTRVQYLEEVATAPNRDGRHPIEGTGGRNDLFFAVHNDDVMKFALPRLKLGIRWIEDVYSNGDGAFLYPRRIAQYKCWEAVVE